jgi:hypothetical protein
MQRPGEYCLILFFLSVLFSACKKEYSYEGGPKLSGYCTSLVPRGNYLVGKELTDSNFLLVGVHITSKGFYSITSDTVNGFSFSGSGTVADTGITELQLAAHGTPVTLETSLFTVQFDSSFCQAQVPVLDTLSNVVQTTNTDLFPLAENNVWSYDDLSYPPDSIVNTITGTSVLNSSLHYVVNTFISFFPATNESYYRRLGVDYFGYEAVSTFTSALDYAPTIYDDINFLKEDCKVGQTWDTPIYVGRTSLGLQVAQLRYEFRCIDADAIVAINGKTFLHVYKIEMRPQAADVGAALQATGEIHTSYYARGIGLIYREFYNGIATHPELQIKWWRIN